MSRRRSRFTLAAALIAFVSTACVSAAKPGVSIDNVEANVVFGLDKGPKPVVPANTAPGEVPNDALGGGFTFRNSAADRLPPLPGEGTQAKPDCPSAPPTAGADKSADATITGPVREGTYRWKRTGTQTRPAANGGTPTTMKITGFEKRLIRNVKKVSDQFDPDTYTFEMVQTLIDQPVVQVRTFKVKPHSSAQVTPGGVPVVDQPRANDPEGGVSLIKVENFDKNGSSLGTFQPSTGLLYLGIPVNPSEQFRSTATDPKSGQTIVADSAVKGRARIDACGDLVDGWRVDSTQTRSDTGGSVAYNYLIAPQYGGVPILEEITTTASDGSTFDVTFSLGQLNPDPLS
jgi:hypothetical protein